jgi:hypothetical protein
MGQPNILAGMFCYFAKSSHGARWRRAEAQT